MILKLSQQIDTHFLNLENYRQFFKRMTIDRQDKYENMGQKFVFTTLEILTTPSRHKLL